LIQILYLDIYIKEKHSYMLISPRLLGEKNNKKQIQTVKIVGKQGFTVFYC